MGQPGQVTVQGDAGEQVGEAVGVGRQHNFVDAVVGGGDARYHAFAAVVARLFAVGSLARPEMGDEDGFVAVFTVAVVGDGDGVGFGGHGDTIHHTARRHIDHGDFVRCGEGDVGGASCGAKGDPRRFGAKCHGGGDGEGLRIHKRERAVGGVDHIDGVTVGREGEGGGFVTDGDFGQYRFAANIHHSHRVGVGVDHPELPVIGAEGQRRAPRRATVSDLRRAIDGGQEKRRRGVVHLGGGRQADGNQQPQANGEAVNEFAVEKLVVRHAAAEILNACRQCCLYSG